MKKLLYILLSLFILILAIYYIWIFPSIPRGLNPYPLYNVTINKDLDLLSKFVNKSINYSLTPLENKNIISITPNSSDPNVFRHIEIYQFNKNSQAIEKYNSYKKTFTDGAERRIYKEEGDNKNSFFISYATTRFDYNHGIPMGILRTPEVMVGFLKNNFFISVSFNSYFDSGTNYINEINADIIYVSKIFKREMTNIP